MNNSALLDVSATGRRARRAVALAVAAAAAVLMAVGGHVATAHVLADNGILTGDDAITADDNGILTGDEAVHSADNGVISAN